MADYFNVKNEPILNPPSGVSLGNLNNQYQTIYASGNLVINNSTFTATALVVPKISTIGYPGNDTAADTAGGQTLTLTGSGFAAGASVVINGVSASVVTVVSSTIITFTAPALAAGSYVVYVINPDGGTAILLPGIQYSGTPSWSTAAGTLGTLYETTAINSTVTATGDAPVSYSLQSGTLPPGASLNSNGTISGTSSATASPTTYTFTIRATDGQNQDTDRQFSMTINPDVVTWNSPPAGNVYAVAADSAISNVALSATSAIGYGIQYTANTLPTGLTLSGNIISGTPTVGGTTNTLLTATANTSSRSATRTISWTVTVQPSYFAFSMDGQVGQAGNYTADIINSVAVASDSKIYTAGWYGRRPYAARHAANGAVEWAKDLGSIFTTGNAGGIFPQIAIDTSNNVYIGHEWFVNSDYKALLQKLDSSGNTAWCRTISALDVNSYGMTERFTDVRVDSNNDIIFASTPEMQDASFYGSRQEQKALLVKFDSSGNTLWQKQWTTPFQHSQYNNQSVDAFSVIIDNNNNIYHSGYYNPLNASSQNKSYCALLKFDSSGNLLWQNAYSSTPGDGDQVFYMQLTTDASGNLYSISQTSGTARAILARLDNSNGNIIWQKMITSAGNLLWTSIRPRNIYCSNNSIYCFAEDYTTTPAYRGFVYIFKFNTDGTIQWQREFKGTDSSARQTFIYSILTDSTDTNMYIAAGARGPDGGVNDEQNGILLKLPTNGSKTGTISVRSQNIGYNASSCTIANTSFMTTFNLPLTVQTGTATIATLSPTTTNISMTTSLVSL